MDALKNMSEEELYAFLINALSMSGHDSGQLMDDDTFNCLWNVLSERYCQYAKGTAIEISDSVSLATFLMDLLEIHNDDDTTEGCEENEWEDYDIELAIEECLGLKENHSFKILWETLKKIPKITFITEEYYIDRVYRDSYYAYYSCKHFEYSRYCKRLFLFSGEILTSFNTIISNIPLQKLQECFIGCIVIRPLETGKVGRSLLNPYFFTENKETYVRHALYDVTMFGKRLYVEAFPYSMQDEETTSCAEITILNLLDYFSKKYAEYKYFLPSEIIEIAIRNGYERRLPTKGLDYLVISKVFMEAGFYPVLYNSDKLEDTSKFKRILHYYIESGIPTAIGLEINKNAKHSIICIGHGKVELDRIERKQYSIPDAYDKDHHVWLIDSADLVRDYIVMDDNQKPYSRYEWEDGDCEKTDLLGNWKPEYLMVPLYKRMFLEAADAYDICTSILADSELGIQKQVSDIGTIDNPMVIRLFMASARGFKKFRINNFSIVNNDIKERYINTPFPRFVWVCEIYRKADYPDFCTGEVIIDATAAPNVKMGSVIILHYPDTVFYQLPDKKSDLQHPVFRKLPQWEKFGGYRGNLHRPNINADINPECKS